VQLLGRLVLLFRERLPQHVKQVYQELLGPVLANSLFVGDQPRKGTNAGVDGVGDDSSHFLLRELLSRVLLLLDGHN
jgi:hypothetical protein